MKQQGEKRRRLDGDSGGEGSSSEWGKFHVKQERVGEAEAKAAARSGGSFTEAGGSRRDGGEGSSSEWGKFHVKQERVGEAEAKAAARSGGKFHVKQERVGEAEAKAAARSGGNFT